MLRSLAIGQVTLALKTVHTSAIVSHTDWDREARQSDTRLLTSGLRGEPLLPSRVSDGTRVLESEAVGVVEASSHTPGVAAGVLVNRSIRE